MALRSAFSKSKACCSSVLRRLLDWEEGEVVVELDGVGAGGEVLLVGDTPVFPLSPWFVNAAISPRASNPVAIVLLVLPSAEDTSWEGSSAAAAHAVVIAALLKDVVTRERARKLNVSVL